jgi:hypothetical protein
MPTLLGVDGELEEEEEEVKEEEEEVEEEKGVMVVGTDRGGYMGCFQGQRHTLAGNYCAGNSSNVSSTHTWCKKSSSSSSSSTPAANCTHTYTCVWAYVHTQQTHTDRRECGLPHTHTDQTTRRQTDRHADTSVYLTASLDLSVNVFDIMKDASCIIKDASCIIKDAQTQTQTQT